MSLKLSEECRQKWRYKPTGRWDAVIYYALRPVNWLYRAVSISQVLFIRFIKEWWRCIW